MHQNSSLDSSRTFFLKLLLYIIVVHSLLYLLLYIVVVLVEEVLELVALDCRIRYNDPIFHYLVCGDPLHQPPLNTTAIPEKQIFNFHEHKPQNIILKLLGTMESNFRIKHTNPEM